MHELSLVTTSRGYSSLWCMGFSLWWLLLLESMGLVTLWHMRSFQTRDQTHVAYIGKWILNHWITKGVT